MFINWQTMARCYHGQITKHWLWPFEPIAWLSQVHPSFTAEVKPILDLMKTHHSQGDVVEWDKCGGIPSMPIPSHASLVIGHVKLSSSEPAET